MTIKHLFPVSKPTLDLNFAAELALDPSITFTRSSIGTYFAANGILQTAADDEPRFDHDGGTGESLGLLIEESRTNTIVNSTNMPAIFTAVELTATPNAGTAPDGTNTAVRLEASANATQHYYQCASGGGATRTYTVFAKADGENTIYLGNYFYASQGFNFDLTDDSEPSGSFPGSITYSYTQKNLANGWKRLSYTIDSYGARFNFIVMPGGNNSNAGTGGAVLIWGPMSENATFPTSYIPTTGSTVTRAADIAQITGDNFSSWYQPLENTMFAKFSTFDTGTNSKAALVTFDSTQGPSINTTVNGGRAFYYVGDTNYIQVTTRTPQKVRRFFANDPVYNPLGQFNSVAQGYAGTDSGCAVNGSDPGYTASAGLNPGTVDSMWIGRDENVSMWLNGHIARIANYPTRLPDEQLQALTS